jgi:hypothetical protein
VAAVSLVAYADKLSEVDDAFQLTVTECRLAEVSRLLTMTQQLAGISRTRVSDWRAGAW